jgi:signal transduction histidine kinase
MVAGSSIVRAGGLSIAVALVCTAAAGLLLFFLLTRRLRAMTSVVRRFREGQYDQRVAVGRADEIGQLGGAFNEMADVLVRNLDELSEADRMRRDLVANISHDLRSPLASVRGYLETVLIKDDTLQPEDRRRFLQIALDRVEGLNELVADLFELAKLDARQDRPEMETFSLAELVQDVALTFGPMAEEKGVSLGPSLPQGLCLVSGNVGMIERALSNLIDNALRHTDAGGTVGVALLAEEHGVQVRVEDTGSGIPPDDLPHVFDRFYMVEKSRGSGGSGLGLAIAQRILEAHESRIEVQSTLGEGTAFWFVLPTPPDTKSRIERIDIRA